MMERELGEGYSFIKKKCFVCGSISHLIRDCDFYEKKMAREAELKKQRVFNTGNVVAKPVWNNANRVNHANHFVPRPVQLIAVRKNVNSVRPNVNTGRANVNSVRQNVNSVRSNVNTGSFNINTVKAKQPINTSNSNSFSPVRPQVNKYNQRSNFSKLHSPMRRPIVRNTTKMSHTHAVKGNWGTDVKTLAGYNWRKTRPNSNCNSGSNFIRTVNAKGPQGIPKPEKAWVVADKYVVDMLKKFDLTSVKTAITPMETKMVLTKNEEVDDVDVTPKTSHLNAMKRIFKYLKGKPNLGL
ncbi:ribonuclease H-like domain-containing protein, partial [Tanacetum coccineum]